MKDRRIKICSNRICYEKNKPKHQPDRLNCPSCGSALVFACKKCQQEIRDAGQSHRVCERCKAESEDLWDKGKIKIKKLLGPVLLVGVIAWKYGKSFIKFAVKALK